MAARAATGSAAKRPGDIKAVGDRRRLAQRRNPLDCAGLALAPLGNRPAKGALERGQLPRLGDGDSRARLLQALDGLREGHPVGVRGRCESASAYG